MIIRKARIKGMTLAMTAGLLLAPAAQASNLDVYYIADSNLEQDDSFGHVEAGSDGGYGAKGQFHINNQLFISGEYQKSDYDELKIEGLGSVPADISLEGIRGGIGFHFLGESPLYVLGEYVRLELEDDSNNDSQHDDGYAVHLGARDILDGGFGYYAQVGYIDVGDFGDGFEGLIGGSFNFSPSIAVFADYRYTKIEGDDDLETELGDFRAGVRLLF